MLSNISSDKKWKHQSFIQRCRFLKLNRLLGCLLGACVTFPNYRRPPSCRTIVFGVNNLNISLRFWNRRITLIIFRFSKRTCRRRTLSQTSLLSSCEIVTHGVVFALFWIICWGMFRFSYCSHIVTLIITIMYIELVCWTSGRRSLEFRWSSFCYQYKRMSCWVKRWSGVASSGNVFNLESVIKDETTLVIPIDVPLTPCFASGDGSKTGTWMSYKQPKSWTTHSHYWGKKKTQLSGGYPKSSQFGMDKELDSESTRFQSSSAKPLISKDLLLKSLMFSDLDEVVDRSLGRARVMSSKRLKVGALHPCFTSLFLFAQKGEGNVHFTWLS